MEMLKKYLENLFQTAKAGDVREESYYPDLKLLFESWSESRLKRKFYITSSPRKTEAGNPDFRVLTAKKGLVGYIEAKTTTVEDLDSVENSGQLIRYRQRRTLSFQDVAHYCRMITAIAKTLSLQEQIDVVYPMVEEKIL